MVNPPTRATFSLPHSSQEPLELSMIVPSLAMAVVHRDSVAKLGAKWAGAIGVYVLLGLRDDSVREAHEYCAYVGKAATGGLKERLNTHRNSPTWQASHGIPKTWWQRALIVRSSNEQGFRSDQAGWLEGRLWEILDNAPAARLVGKKGKDETPSKEERDELELFLPAITAVLRAIGASPDTPDQVELKPKIKKRRNPTVGDLIEAELLSPGTWLRSRSAMHEAKAVVLPDGRLDLNGTVYDTPSGAAVAVAGHEMNGWNFWGSPSGDGTLVPLADLRKRLEPASDTDSAGSTPEPVAVPEPVGAPTKQGALKPLLDSSLLTTGATIFGKYKGARHEATVSADGRIQLADGSVHDSPSAASVHIVGYETNGWTFWKTEGVDGEIVSLKALRGKASSRLTEIEIIGTLDGETVELQVRDGAVTGSMAAELAVASVIDAGDEVGLTPEGPFYKPGFDEHWQAVATCAAAFDELIEVKPELELPYEPRPPGVV